MKVMPPDEVRSGSSRQAGAPVALRHIVKTFDHYRAIDDLSLDIEPASSSPSWAPPAPASPRRS
jgi:hypothetical protein